MKVLVEEDTPSVHGRSLLSSVLRIYATSVTPDMNDIDEYLRVCESAVRTGGAVVQDWVGRIEVRKKGHADLVTQADLASQEAVRQIVLGRFPEHCLLGEEKKPGEVVAERAEYRWIVDPLDGTTNYVHGVPHYSVSLALERNGDLLVGAVYDPVLDECFTAATGRGAWLNGQPIHTSEVDVLSEALAAVGFPPKVSRGLARSADVPANGQPLPGHPPHRVGSPELVLPGRWTVRPRLVVFDEHLGRRRRDIAFARGRRLDYIHRRRGFLP